MLISLLSIFESKIDNILIVASSKDFDKVMYCYNYEESTKTVFTNNVTALLISQYVK